MTATASSIPRTTIARALVLESPAARGSYAMRPVYASRIVGTDTGTATKAMWIAAAVARTSAKQASTAGLTLIAPPEVASTASANDPLLAALMIVVMASAVRARALHQVGQQ